MNIIISGGGTGGHIFPAIAIAKAIKAKQPEAQILFVGANGRMEMERVPAAGFNIVGLNIQGFQRSLSVQNLLFPFKVTSSMLKAIGIIRNFKPDMVIGVGGYASGPILMAAQLMGKPTLIQEQNSHAGVTNKILGKRAKNICVAYNGMEKFFPKDKIILTGNPIRQDLKEILTKRNEAIAHYGLDAHKKTIVITGGSLGARTLNNSVKAHLEQIKNTDVQVIWQTGKYYYKTILAELEGKLPQNIKVLEFLERMDLAYAAADVIISRAGAGTISELTVVAKPAILVPSPNVAEDHQTSNAMALVNNNAAILITDANALKELIPQALELITNTELQNTLSHNISQLALPHAAETIAELVLSN